MIEAAVRKNPKSPSFVGLDAFLSHAFDENGGVVVAEFQKYVADEQKAEAQVMKQYRMWQEEQEAAAASDANPNKKNKKQPPGQKPGANE